MNRNKTITNQSFRFKRFARKSFAVFNSIQKAVTIGVLSGCALLSAHASSVNPVEKTVLYTNADTIPERELDEVVVTASKAALPLNLAAKQVTLISSREIERAPIQSIEDLLTRFADVDILQRGPHGVQADISLRGGSFDQTAILINGINLTNPQTGHYSFDIPLNLSDIERIEIVQGPSSLVYGAGAFSGGVNIITKKDTQSNLYAKIEGGMHALFGAEARGAFKTGSSLHQLSAGYRRSDGYIRNSDYNILNLLWQSRFDTESAHIDFMAGYNDKNYGANTFYSPKYPNQYDDTESLFLSIKGETYGKLKFIPQIYWKRHFDEFQLIRNGTPDVPDWYTAHNNHRSDLFGINLNMQYASSWGVTSFGGEFRNEGVLSTNLGKPMKEAIGKFTMSDNRSNISYFAEHNFIFDKITFSMSGLLNYNTAIENKYDFYPALNASFRASKTVSLYASWSKATRMPTFTDWYYVDPEHIGNPELLPEYTQSAEAGFKFRNQAVRATLTGFYTRGENLIDWLYNETDAKWHSHNLAKGEHLITTGLSVEAAIDLRQTFPGRHPFSSFQVGYQFLNQDNSTPGEGNPISQYVLNYLKHKLTANLHLEPVKNLTLSLNFRWQDRAGSYLRYVDLKATEKEAYKPFAIVDAKAAYQLGKLNFFVNANNLFNTTFLDMGNLPQPGLWMTAGISCRIE